jgi:hypothetical protein
MKDISSTVASIPEVREPWMRLPKAGDKLWGLARTQWVRLCQRKKIKSILLKEPGATRGIRLIQRKSAILYFRNLLQSQ